MPSASRLTSPERRDLRSLGTAIAVGLPMAFVATVGLGVFLAIAVFILVSLAT